MSNTISTYKARFSAIPEPLKKQVLTRLAFAIMFLLLFALVLIARFGWMSTVPFLCLAIFSAVSARLLLSQAAAGNYVVIRGRCIEVTATPIRKRSKSILVQADDHVIQLMMKQKPKRIPVGVDLEIYVATKTPVYEKDGMQLIHTYLAIHITRNSSQIHN